MIWNRRKRANGEAVRPAGEQLCEDCRTNPATIAHRGEIIPAGVELYLCKSCYLRRLFFCHDSGKPLPLPASRTSFPASNRKQEFLSQ